MISSGSLTETITILRASEVDDGYQTQFEYAPVITLPAKVEPLSDREVWQAAAAQSNVTHRVTIRLSPSVTVQRTDRVEYNGETYEVQGLKLFPRHGFAEITIG